MSGSVDWRDYERRRQLEDRAAVRGLVLLVVGLWLYAAVAAVDYYLNPPARPAVKEVCR